MKKIFFTLFLCVILAACASKPEPEPALYVPSRPNPEIIIEYTSASALVTFSYNGSRWLFIEGVELINAAGETRKCIIKTPRRYPSGDKVYESGVFSVADVDAFKAWLGDNPRARVVCDYPQEFEAIIFINDN